MSIQRYDLEHCSGEESECRAKMVTHSSGDWVEFSDFEDLESVVDDLKVKIIELEDKIDRAKETLS
jgi:hypothetical protein